MDNHAKPSVFTSPKIVRFCFSAMLLLMGTTATQATATAEVITKIQELGSDNRQHRLAAVKVLKQMGSTVVPVLVEALEDPDPAIRRSAAYGLGVMGLQDSDTIAALLSHLKDPDPAVRMDVAVALQQLGPASDQIQKTAIADFIEALNHEDKAVREGATFALGTLGKEAAPAIAQLIAALKDSDEEVRISAAIALRRIGSPAVPALTKALTDADMQVRTKAAFALGKIESALIPAMTAALENSDRQLHQNVAKSPEKTANRRVEANRPFPVGSQPIRPNTSPSPSPIGSQPIRPNSSLRRSPGGGSAYPPNQQI